MIATYVELARDEIAKEAANLIELRDLSNLQLQIRMEQCMFLE